MNDQYNTVIEHRGRLYRYDPDFDCFYPVSESSHPRWDRWGWLAVILVLGTVAWAVSQ